MTAFIEREEFSKRLWQAMRDAGYNHHSPTQLARQFNARFGGDNVSVHAARKWLLGEAIPTQEKLRVLARWLGVEAEWLRYGAKEPVQPATAYDDVMRFDRDDIALLSDLQRLDELDRVVAREIVRLFVSIKAGNVVPNS